MKLERKKGIGKIKITHNKTLFWVIILLMVLLIGLIYFIVHNSKEKVSNQEKTCVPATCCHPTECILAEEAPLCERAICTMSCSGPLDCGAGHCEYINNKCEVVSDE